MYKYLLFILAMVSGVDSIYSQSLNDFLKIGLDNNRQLKATRSSQQVASRSLEEAQRLKTVRLDFAPTYTLAAGGRVIAIPVGDLLNPVYGALNTLTGSQQFPQIENVEELLNPNNFYDVKVSASYPIINSAIGVNEDIKVLELGIANQEIAKSRLELSGEIAKAYYDYQQANGAVDVYTEAMLLVSESIRVNRGLLNQGAALSIELRAAQNDSIQLDKELMNAELAKKQAAAYLNFLVDQPLDIPITIVSLNSELPVIPTLESARVRPALLQLEALSRLNAKLGDLAKAQSGPQLNAFADAGVQDFDFNLSGQSPYVLAGLSFTVNLYDGGQTKAKQQLALAQQAETNARRQAVIQQIELEVFNIRQQLEKSSNEFAALEREIIIRSQQYQNQQRRYQAGTINYIELQTARTELIQARLQRNITRFQVWKEVADYKRALGIEQ